MRTFLCCLGGALIGIITSHFGLGYFKDGAFNLIGAITNIFSCIIWVLLVFIWTRD